MSMWFRRKDTRGRTYMTSVTDPLTMFFAGLFLLAVVLSIVVSILK